MKHPVIFWDVDTQHDFMDPDGKLYVKGAELIKPKLEQLTNYAHAHGIQIVASSDDHELEHAEISAAPDFRETFPPHWVGTTIRWDVEPRDDGSTVNFRHDGFSEDGHAGHAAFTWGQIMVQLKKYAESGSPAPVFA